MLPVGTQQSLSDVVYDSIRRWILDGTWPPRSRLPSEAALVAQFGISRPVVRQALARLRDSGLVVSRQGSGSFVQDIDRLEPVVHFPPIGSVADLERFLAFREGVEGEAAATAAIARTEKRVGELRTIIKAKPATASNDFQFHLAVASASENPFYLNTLASLNEQLMFGMNLTRSFGGGRRDEVIATIAEQHAAIATAIIDRDAEAARALMRSHLQWSRARMLTGAAE